MLTNDEGRCKADNVIVGFLAKDSVAHQLLAKKACSPCFRKEFHADHQPPAPHFPDERVFNSLQFTQEVGTHGGGILDHPFFDEHFKSCSGHGAGQWVAAEGATVLTRTKHPQDFRVGQNRGYGVKAARKGFADEADVRLDSLMLLRQELAGSAQTGLDLVQDKNHLVLLADGLGFF